MVNNCIKGSPKYAWLPTKTESGWVWLALYRQIYVWDTRYVWKEVRRIHYGLGYEEPILKKVRKTGWFPLKKVKIDAEVQD